MFGGNAVPAAMNGKPSSKHGSKGGMCPVCAERAVLQGYNDLGTTDPHLLSEWDYEKNSKWTPSNVSRNSMKVVWWKCGAGHSYRAKITDRTIEQKGCPQCEAEFQQALPQMLIMMYLPQKGSCAEEAEKHSGQCVKAPAESRCLDTD